MTLGLFALAAVSLALAAAACVFMLARRPVPPSPTLGLAGLKRSRALARSSVFALLEPPMRVVAGWVSALPLDRVRTRLGSLLAGSGYWLGLSADELCALCALGGAVGLFFGWVLALLWNTTQLFLALVAALGTWIPYAMVSSEAQQRRRQIDRELPSTIDLVALCMSAGMDFPGALRQISRERTGGSSALDEELRLILQELDLGHPRRDALLAFARRVPSEAVSEFVSAVVQSEEKGNPLAEVLVIQAGVLRQRRTIMAEEAASRAAVLMIAPLVLLILATLLLIAGPLVIRTINDQAGRT
jgi:tight adherence protein C